VNDQKDQSLLEAGAYPNGPAHVLLLKTVTTASLDPKRLSSVCRPVKLQVSKTHTYGTGHLGGEGTGMAPITK
jgi:hypothetical protein